MLKIVSKNISPQFLIGTFTTILLLPFVDKAFHMDDPMFIWAAQNILTNPLDFYSGYVNWHGTAQAMYDVNKNPPLVSYYIALIAYFFGWFEIPVHAGFILLAIGAVIGIYNLSKLYTSNAIVTAFIGLSMPVFLISSTNIMSDTLMTCLYIWAVYFWVNGVKFKNKRHLIISSLTITLAALTKYFAISLIPLLIFYTLLIERKITKDILFFAIPIVLLYFYNEMTGVFYGVKLISSAVVYSGEIEKIVSRPSLFYQILTSLTYLGGCFLTYIFFIIKINELKKYAYIFLFIFSLSLLLYLNQSVFSHVIFKEERYDFFLILHYVLYFILGLYLLYIIISETMHNRSIEYLMLLIWFFGGLVFVVFFNWTISGRNFLPILAPVSIFVASRMQFFNSNKNNNEALFFSIRMVLSLALSLLVVLSDYNLANAQREVSKIFKERFNSIDRNVWFQGHWGLQYYLERNGSFPIDLNHNEFKENDIAIIPLNNTNVYLFPKDSFFYKVDTIDFNFIGPFTTMSSMAMTGFYWGNYGPLPFSFTRNPMEQYLIYIVGRFEDTEHAIKIYNETTKP